MEDKTIEKNIYDGGVNLLNKLNLFTALHALWLLELYYLGANAIYNSIIAEDQSYIKKMPEIVLKYNDVILAYFNEYNEFIKMVACTVFICGFSYAFITLLPVFKNIKIIKTYASYGVICAFWLITIHATYNLYLWLGVGVLLAPIIVFITVEIVKKILMFVEEKTGIKFPEMLTR